MYEDKQTKKQRREELFQRKKASNSDYVNELRREIYDLPEEVHLGGMASQKSKFAREQEVIEKYELENFKRVQFTKKEIKEQRAKAQAEMQERADRFDDLKGLENILGGKRRVPEERKPFREGNGKFNKSLSNFAKKKQGGGKDRARDKKGGFKKKKNIPDRK